jgi:hypothetical protein
VRVMRALLSGWLAAVIVAALALAAMKGLAPMDGRPFDEYAQVLRVHLPWLLSSVLMAFVAGFYVRDRSGGWWRLGAGLPIPMLAAFAGTQLGIQTAQSVLAVGLRLIEALLGVALGLFLIDRFGDGSRTGRIPGSSNGVWEDSRH